MADNKLKEQEIGVLWVSKSGNENYLGGHLVGKDGKKTPIFLLRNKFCENPQKQPTWRIYLDKGKAEQQTPVNQTPTTDDPEDPTV